MGYTTRFAGEIDVHPPLNEAERDFLRRFSQSRRVAGLCAVDDGEATPDGNRLPDGRPGPRCGWVPSEDGATLVWDGFDGFSRPAEWLAYLVDVFLRPGARAEHALTHAHPGWVLPEQLRAFTFDHTLHGTVVVAGQDGATWRLEVRGTEVTVTPMFGPAPVQFVQFLSTERRLADLDPEFDVVVVGCVRERFPDAVCRGSADDDHLEVRDERAGLSVTVWDRDIRIGLHAGRTLSDTEDAFVSVEHLAQAITRRTGWVAYGPARRVALRPEDRFAIVPAG